MTIYDGRGDRHSPKGQLQTQPMQDVGKLVLPQKKTTVKEENTALEEELQS